MGNVVIDMSMSVDGYIAAPNDNPEQGLGEDGMRLHNWAFDDPSVFGRVYGNLVEETGAVIMGRRSYDNSIEAWGGKGPLGEVPCFVVTHEPLANADPVFTFVTDGIESALAKAREAAAGKRIGPDDPAVLQHQLPGHVEAEAGPGPFLPKGLLARRERLVEGDWAIRRSR